MLEAALKRLAVDLRGLADTLPRIDALEAYLDLARPLVDECDGRDRLWVNARVEEIWSACPAAAGRRAGSGRQRYPGHPVHRKQRAAQPGVMAMPALDGGRFVPGAGPGIKRH